MQRILSTVKTVTSLFSYPISSFGKERLLQPIVPTINPVCNFKVKGRVHRRCQACYMVVRDERLYVICPKHPRHKQMVMKPKPLNTYILTHASQSPVRPW